jgi:hypothetical protein
MKATPFPDTRWKSLEDLAGWLRDRFPEACLHPDETEIQGRVRSAEVLLARRIATTILNPHDDDEEE